MDIAKTYTLEDVQRALPSRKSTITQELVDIINEAQTEPEFQGETLLQSMVSYEGVMQKAQVGIKEYVRALRFCAYLMSMDDNYTEAYKKAFFDRDFVRERMSLPTESVGYRELTSAASRYRKSRIVVDILTLSQVPLDLMFAGYRYKAVGVLADVMMTAKQDRDKINAAKELLAATKGPDNVKMELEVGPNKSAVEIQTKLFDQLAQLSRQQHARLLDGEGIDSVQRIGISCDVVEAEING